MKHQERIDCVTAEFEKRYGQLPTMWGRAPGRVDLMGSHTDYNEGHVMTMAIDRDTWLAFRPRPDRQVRIASLNMSGDSTFSLDDITHDDQAPWANYVRGVAWALADEAYPLTGFDGLIHSTIPFGSGLSSSAALEVATGVVFQMLGEWEMDAVKLALIGQKAENKFVGVNSGILDQYSSALGRAGHTLMLDCRHLSHTMARIPDGVAVVICDTRAPRELTGSEYGDRRAQCEEGVRLLRQFYPDIGFLRDVSPAQFAAHEADLPPVVAKRCRFIIEENRRVLDLGQALVAGDLATIERLAADSYQGARDLYEIGAPAMEAMMQAMRRGPGVIGARQAGAGFGGCMVAFVSAPLVCEFAEYVQKEYATATGLEPKVYPVQAAAGAGQLLLI